ARRTIVRRIQAVLPEQCRRILYLLLRLLPARSVSAHFEPVYRKRSFNKRGNRETKAERNVVVADRTTRRDRRRVRIMHIRYWKPGGVRQECNQTENRRKHTAQPASVRSCRHFVQSHRGGIQ